MGETHVVSEMGWVLSCARLEKQLVRGARVLVLAAVCAAAAPSWAQKQAGGAPAGQAVVTYRGETLTRPELNQMLQMQRQAMQGAGGGQGGGQMDQNADLFAVYGWLRDEALMAAAEEMKVQPSEQDIRKQEQELRKQLTPENWQKMQAGSQFAIQAVDRYRQGLASGGANDAQLRNSIWQEMGGDRNPAGVPRQAFEQTLTAVGRDDAAYQELKASIPASPDDAVAKAREEFAEASRLMRVQDSIAGKLQVTDEEVARAKQSIPPEGQQQMNKAPGGFKGALLAMKKQHAVDEWLRPRILSQAKFADKNLERRFRAMLEQAGGQGQGGAPQQQQGQGQRQAPAGAVQQPSRVPQR